MHRVGRISYSAKSRAVMIAYDDSYGTLVARDPLMKEACCSLLDAITDPGIENK